MPQRLDAGERSLGFPIPTRIPLLLSSSPPTPLSATAIAPADGGSSIDMDPESISTRWMSSSADVFDFNLPLYESSFLVHADQIFSDGLLLPLHSATAPKLSVAYDCSSKSLPSRRSTFCSSPSRAASSISSHLPVFLQAKATPSSASSCSSIDLTPKSWKPKLHFFRNCTRPSKRTLRRCLCFLMPLYKKVKCLRLVSSKTVRSRKDSAGGSPKPKTSNPFSSVEWCRSNADISIHDAILHCKRSIATPSDNA
ncbi:uncharacterized protein LOC103970265 [Musa acuminata AAA Group]|uniref:uncharacterized protein LOC103970265 n=1 Tax=Musa acuminata AAA Group TaxID=214697 RepID=UPI0031E05CA9